MVEQSNPRKLYRSGGAIVVSLPDSIRQELDVERGDRVVLTAENGSGTIEPVEWRQVDS
jgi:antitoxin component of MazEF toxin-antitoxin module